jgi:ABC-type dipeptide/oligopeptide/nickel transport system ATPase component
MENIAKLTGQAETRHQIFEAFTANTCQIFRVVGPSGSGKSWLGESVSREWYLLAGVTLVAQGVESLTRRNYYPLLGAISAESARFQLSTLKSALSNLATEIPVGGSSLRDLLDYFVNRKELLRKINLPYLTNDELEILARMDSLIGKRKALLLCEDFQWWDRASLEFLSLCMRPSLQEIFPFLANLKILVLQTSGVPCAELDYIESILKTEVVTTSALSYCNEEAFGVVLKEFGTPQDLPKHLLGDLYKICCGHLELARRLAQSNSKWSQDSQQDMLMDLQHTLHELLEIRLQNISPVAEQTMVLLQAASVIGKSFSETELSCLMNLSAQQIREVLKPAEMLRLVNLAVTGGVFVHDIVRNYFFDRANPVRKSLDQKFANCLALFNPGEYSRRAEYLFRAGEADEAEEVLILEYLVGRRKGIKQNKLYVTNIVSKALKSFLEKMENSVSQFELGNYSNVIELLNTIEDIYSDRLLAERDILAARSHIKLLTLENRLNAVDLLHRWSSLDESEPEIWGRVMLYLVVAYVFVGNTTAALKTEKELIGKLRPRLKFDPASVRMLNHCRLKANMLHSSTVARQRLQDAITFFGPQYENCIPEEPVHYYIGLLNLSANYIANGAFECAFELAERAKYTVVRFSVFSFPRPDILVNNLILSEFLCGRITAKKAAGKMLRMMRTIPASNDNTLLKSNVAWLFAMMGNYKAVVLSLEPVYQSLIVIDEIDGYYIYFLGNNLAGAFYMLGEKQRAVSIWKDLNKHIKDIVGPMADYITRRHELQSEIFVNTTTNLQDWESYLSRNYPLQVGPGWKFYGNGFLASDLEFWSDE